MFEKGDFIKMSNFNDEFGIFEGKEIGTGESYSYYKKYSLVAYYNEKKYTQTQSGKWEQLPYIEVAKNGNPCNKGIDSYYPSYQYSKMNEDEKKHALEILRSYGYEWDEDTFSLISIESGEVLYQIKRPNNEYHGEVVKPMNAELKCKLRKALKSVVDKPSSYSGGFYYNQECERYSYGDYYDD